MSISKEPHTQIVPHLHRIQARYGYLPIAAMRAFSQQSGVPLYRLQAVASFFPHFRDKPCPPVQVRVCRDMACHLRRSCEVLDDLRESAQNEIESGMVSVEGVSCIGRCDRAPAGFVTTIVNQEQSKTFAENACLFTGFDSASLIETVRQTVAAVRSDVNQKPRGETDRDWVPPDLGDWKIDMYKSMDADYLSVRRFAKYAHLNLAFGERVSQYQVRDSNLDEIKSMDDSSDTTVVDKFLADRETLFKGIVDEGGLSEFEKEGDIERRRVISAIYQAELLGMGGAGGRVYKKWFEVRKANPASSDGTKYVICNGDESEPGTFKDREILLRFPHLVLEGLILGGLMVGASRGFIYIRHEYHEQIEAVRAAIKLAEEKAVCGDNVLGTGYSFNVEVFVSPGGYICGEQTALVEAMENKRAEPRNRPPELVTNGFLNMPTLLHNVETLAWIPSVITRSLDSRLGGCDNEVSSNNASTIQDGLWFANSGVKRHYNDRVIEYKGQRVPCPTETKQFLGLRLITISGDVERPGVYEIQNGTTLGELIDKRALGMRGGQQLQAFAPSGPSGGFFPGKIAVDRLPEKFLSYVETDQREFDMRDMPLDIQASRDLYQGNIGAAIIVYGDKADMVAETISCLRFFRNESCGKCVPCRIGSQKLVEIALQLRELNPSDRVLIREMLDDLADVMKETSICSLGSSAAKPLMSLLDYFADTIY